MVPNVVCDIGERKGTYVVMFKLLSKNTVR